MLTKLFSFISSWDFWVWFGLFAQLFFFLRFVAQWIATERARRVTIPAIFWHLSLVGGVLILVYSIARHDIVFILGSALSLFIYARNLWLHYNGEHEREIDGGPDISAAAKA